MIKIYCEDGATIQAVREIGKLPEFKLISFPFENRNKRTIKSNMPSHVTADSIFMTADNTLIKIGNTSFSKKYEEIKAVIGQENLNDIRHFDTASKKIVKYLLLRTKRILLQNRCNYLK